MYLYYSSTHCIEILEVIMWLNLNYGMSTMPDRPRREAKNGLSHVRFFGKHVRFFRHRARFLIKKKCVLNVKHVLNLMKPVLQHLVLCVCVN